MLDMPDLVHDNTESVRSTKVNQLAPNVELRLT